MRILLVALVLLSCTGALLATPASAFDLTLTKPATVAPTTPGEQGQGSFDPYVGQGDLLTKAVPVCCCSFGFCEDTPNAPCTGGPPSCRCNALGGTCVHI